MVFLGILCGIILFFVALLSVPLKVSVAYENYVTLKVRWLFLKIGILPLENKEKKEKKPKKEKQPKEEKPKEEPKDEAPKEKKPSPIMDMVKANGYDGLMDIITNVGRYLGKMGAALFHSVKFDTLILHLVIGKGDAARTAIEYGEACAKVYPVFGYICSHNYVKKYDVSVDPDFLANKNKGELFAEMSICPRKIINAGIALVFRLIFGAGVKFILNGKKKPEENTSNPKSQQTV